PYRRLPRPADTVDAYRLGNVLQRFGAEVLEAMLSLVPNLIEGSARDENPSRIGQRFQPSRDVDTVTKPILAFDNHVPQIDGQPQIDAPISCGSMVASRHLELQRCCAF